MSERYIVQSAYVILDTADTLNIVEWFDDIDDAFEYADELNEDYNAGIE